MNLDTSKAAANDEFYALSPERWAAEKRLAEQMVALREGPMAGLLSEDAKTYWDEYLRLLTDAVDNPSLLW